MVQYVRPEVSSEMIGKWCDTVYSNTKKKWTTKFLNDEREPRRIFSSVSWTRSSDSDTFVLSAAEHSRLLAAAAADQRVSVDKVSFDV